MTLISSDLATVHIVGTVLIIVFGGLGCGGPMMLTSYAGRNAKVMRYQSILQLLLTALGAGVVICTALVHILPDGMGMLASGGLGGDESSTGGDTPTTTSNNTSFQPTNVTSTAPADGDDDEAYPYGPMLMLLGMLVTYVIDSELHKLADDQQEATMKAHVTELGIAVHSVLVGVAYGAMTSIDPINTLSVALMFHQLCEGFAMAPLFSKGARSTFHAVVLVLIFALSLPIGIGIGALALQYGDPGSKQANLSQGILSCLAAGMLMYVGAVEFLGGLQRATGGHDHGHSHTTGPLSTVNGGGKEESASLLIVEGYGKPLCRNAETEESDAPPPPPSTTTTFLEDYPSCGRLGAHLMVLVGGTAMAVLAIYA